MSITTDIQKAKEKLIKKASKTGIYENFGQKEVRELYDKYYISNEIRDFDEWCMTYNGGKK